LALLRDDSEVGASFSFSTVPTVDGSAWIGLSCEGELGSDGNVLGVLLVEPNTADQRRRIKPVSLESGIGAGVAGKALFMAGSVKLVLCALVGRSASLRSA
jgi:hypothetical protein